MNYPSLPLKDCEETIAFKAIDLILKSDPTIRRVVGINYNSWTGDARDIMPPAPSLCPFLQIAPTPAKSSRWETEGQQRMPITIGITVAVIGTDVRQLMNLWGAVRRALFPIDPTARDANRVAAQNARITKPTLALQGYGVSLPKSGDRMLIAQGQLQLVLLVDTP